jgi:hypothetical protein
MLISLVVSPLILMYRYQYPHDKNIEDFLFLQSLIGGPALSFVQPIIATGTLPTVSNLAGYSPMRNLARSLPSTI